MSFILQEKLIQLTARTVVFRKDKVMQEPIAMDVLENVLEKVFRVLLMEIDGVTTFGSIAHMEQKILDRRPGVPSRRVMDKPIGQFSVPSD